MKRLFTIALVVAGCTLHAELFRIISITPYPGFAGIYRLQFRVSTNVLYTVQRATNVTAGKLE
jgi:hypothetical protein